MTDIHSFFPLATERPLQTALLNSIAKAIEKDDIRAIIIEAPVGSGKSALGVAIARWLGSSHVLTPRKSLQTQYFQDFQDHLVLMKGRNAYPCTFHQPSHIHRKVIQMIQQGEVKAPRYAEDSCASGPCKDDKDKFLECMDKNEVCPYHAAIEVARGSNIIVHNLHSFIFQAHFAGRFDQRSVLLIDEAHEIEGIIRNFAIKKFVIPRLLKEDEQPGEFTTLAEWGDYFSDPRFLPEEGTDKHKDYMDALNKFYALSENFGDRFVVDRTDNETFGYTKFEFIPDSIGTLAARLLFDYGERVVMMSGTIYDKRQFCRNVGLNPDQVLFLKIGSGFPVASRPIYMKDDYLVDTSHRMWKTNLPEIIEKINLICEKFPDAKGLIHAPSYEAAQELALTLARAGNDRIVMHERDNFQSKLETFFASTGNDVFISPVCQQGVDFKGDRARFQIVLRVPYPNAGDPFMAYKVENDFPWYNYQALVTFGQQIGRVNRSEDDFGVTVLMDARFPAFIARNRRVLPKWLLDAIIT